MFSDVRTCSTMFGSVDRPKSARNRGIETGPNEVASVIDDLKNNESTQSASKADTPASTPPNTPANTPKGSGDSSSTTVEVGPDTPDDTPDASGDRHDASTEASEVSEKIG